MPDTAPPADRDAFLRLWSVWYGATGDLRADLGAPVYAAAASLRAEPGPTRVVLQCASEGVARVRAAMLASGGLTPEVCQNVFVIVHVAHPADVTLAMYGAGSVRGPSLAVLCARHGVPFARTFGRIFPQAAQLERWAVRYRKIRTGSRALV